MQVGKVGAGKEAPPSPPRSTARFDELASLLASLVALKELTPRTRDFVVSRGERLSAQMFAAALAAAGTPSAYVDATEIVFTDGPFGGASPNLALTDAAARKKLQPLIAAGKVPVVPGFIGSADIEDDAGSATGEARAVATLGRGGSDLTATLLGRALGARDVSLWKDVPGLLTADPRVVPDARVIPQLHLREAAELAYYGAKVLHPRALIPVAGRPMPVFVRPFADPAAPGHRDLGAPHAGQVSGQGAVGGGRAGADHRRRQRHAGRARHRGAHVRGAAPRGDQRLADLAVVVGAVDLLLGARARRQARARRACSRSSATRSRARTSTASRCRTAWRRVAVVGPGHGRATAASRRACSRRWRTRASTSSPSRRARRS